MKIGILQGIIFCFSIAVFLWPGFADNEFGGFSEGPVGIWISG